MSSETPECGRDFCAGSKGEADLVSSHGRFVWYELMTTDIETAAFYANVGLGHGILGARLGL
jgi:hypothetical protein